MQFQNVNPSTALNLNKVPVLAVVPMSHADEDKLKEMVDEYITSVQKIQEIAKQHGLTESELRKMVEENKFLRDPAELQESEAQRISAIQKQIPEEIMAAKAKLENSKKRKEELDEKLRQIENREAEEKAELQIAIRKVIVSEIKKGLQLTAEQSQSLATGNEALLDSIKLNKAKRCLVIDKVAMENVLLPLIVKYNLIIANFAVFKDEISEDALLTFFATVPNTKIKAISIAKPLSANENDAKAKIEALIAQRGGVIKIS